MTLSVLAKGPQSLECHQRAGRRIQSPRVVRLSAGSDISSKIAHRRDSFHDIHILLATGATGEFSNHTTPGEGSNYHTMNGVLKEQEIQTVVRAKE